MDKEELKKLLKENLAIFIKIEVGQSADYITVKLCFDGEVIDECGEWLWRQ